MRYSRQDETASHVVLIPAVTVVLIYLGKDADLRVGAVRRACGTVGVIARRGRAVAGGPLVWTGGSALVTPWGCQSVRSPSCGSEDFCCSTGRAAFRAALFPLLFLAFMIPIPSLVLDGLIFFLRSGSTDAVEAACSR